jgi:hypothetical protein
VPLKSDGLPGYGATGSDMPLLDGLIRGSEVQAGRIDHALTVATNDTASTFRWPAAKSDGHNAYPPGIPEGARVQLDPSVNCAAIGGSVIETEICRALEEYGAFVKDTTSPALSVGFQDEGTVGPGNPYYGAGLTADELKITHIPLSRLRVLASGSQEPPPTAAVPHTPSGCAITEHREGTTAWLTLGCAADPSEDNVSSYELYRAGPNRTQLSGGAETGFGLGAPWTTAPTPVFFNRLYVSVGEDECYSVAARNSAGVSPRSPWECVTP